MTHFPYYDNGGTHWGLWIVMVVAMLVFFGILAWAVVSIIRHKYGHATQSAQSPAVAGSDALWILDERLARGDEYTRRRDALKRTNPTTDSG